MSAQFAKLSTMLPNTPGVRLLSDVVTELQRTNSDWLADDFRCYRKALEILHAAVCACFSCFQAVLFFFLAIQALNERINSLGVFEILANKDRTATDSRSNSSS